MKRWTAVYRRQHCRLLLQRIHPPPKFPKSPQLLLSVCVLACGRMRCWYAAVVAADVGGWLKSVLSCGLTVHPAMHRQAMARPYARKVRLSPRPCSMVKRCYCHCTGALCHAQLRLAPDQGPGLRPSRPSPGMRAGRWVWRRAAVARSRAAAVAGGRDARGVKCSLTEKQTVDGAFVLLLPRPGLGRAHAGGAQGHSAAREGRDGVNVA